MQSGRLWNQKVIGFLKTLGFKPLNADPSILISNRNGKSLMMSVYVNNFLLASSNSWALQWLKSGISNEYNVKNLGEVCTIIRWQVTRNHVAETLKIDQSSFMRDLIKSEIMTNYNSVYILMKTGCFIKISEPGDYEEADIKPYQQLIGKLMYLSYGTRPDIAFAVGQLSKHNSDPKTDHMKTAKKTVRYLKGTMHLELVYRSHFQSNVPAAPSLFGLIGYGNSSYTSDPKDKKSVIGYFYFLNKATISWCSKKQRTVSTSTTEAKYITLGHIAQETVWLKCFFNELQVVAQPVNSMTLYGDNEINIILTKNAKSQHCTKHIDVQHHYIQELIDEGELKVNWIFSSNMLANRFTKALSTNTFRRHRAALEMAS